MATYTPQQIREKALALEAAGASDAEIDEFVTDAREASSQMAAPAPAQAAPAPAQAAPVSAPQAAARPQGAPRAMMSGSYQAFTGGQPQSQELDPQFRGQLARYGVPLATAVAFPPAAMGSAMGLGGIAGTAAGFAGLGAVGAGANTVARGLEGKPMANRESGAEAARAFAEFGAPVPKLASLGATGVLSAARKFLTRGAVIGGANVATINAGEAARRSVMAGELDLYDKGPSELSTYKRVVKTAKDNAVPFFFGGALGAFGGGAEGTKRSIASMEGMKRIRERLGDKNPTLAGLIPSLTDLETAVARGDRGVLNQISGSNQGVFSEVKRMFAHGDVSNAEIADKVNPMLQRMMDLESTVVAATKAKDQATQAAADLAKRVDLPPEAYDALKNEVRVAQANAVLAKAQALRAAEAEAVPLLKNSTFTTRLGESVQEIIDMRSLIMSDRMSKVGLDEAVPRFAVDDVVQTAINELGAGYTTNHGKDIVAAIVKAAGKAEDGTPNGMLNIAQIKGLKTEMSKAFAGVPVGNMSGPEAMMTRTYGAINARTREIIKNDIRNTSPDPDAALAAYDEAQAFWGATAEIQKSRLGKFLLAPGSVDRETADGGLRSIAAAMAKGDTQEVEGFKKFVDLIGDAEQALDPTKSSKVVAEHAMEALTHGLRNAMRWNFKDGSRVDHKGLVKYLNAAASATDELPIPIEAFGWGNKVALKHWEDVFDELPKGTFITPEMSDKMLSNPLVVSALKHGGSGTGAVLKAATAEVIYTSMVEDSFRLAYTNSTAAARRAAQEAEAFAKARGIDADTAKRLYDTAKADPVLGALAGQKKLLSNEAGKDGGEGTISDMVNKMHPKHRKAFMGGLWQQDPQVATIVEGRIIADTFAGMTRLDNAADSGLHMLDANKLKNFFNPQSDLGENSLRESLRQSVRPEVFNRIQQFTRRLSILDHKVRNNKTPGKMEFENLMGLGAAAIQVPGTGIGSRMSFVNKATHILQSKAYHTLATVLQEPKVVRPLIYNAADIGSVLGTVPGQKAFMLIQNRPLLMELGELDSAENAPQSPRN